MIDEQKIRNVFKKLKDQQVPTGSPNYKKCTLYFNGKEHENIPVSEEDGEIYIPSNYVKKLYK